MGLFDRFSERIGDFLDEVFIPEGLRSRLERASRLIEKEKFQQALDLLEEARQVHDDHHRTHHLVGLCHFGLENWEAALEAFEGAIELRDEPATRLYAGRTAERLGAARDAKLHYQAALRSAEPPPHAFELRLAHGRVLLALDRPEKSAHELRKADQLQPDRADVSVGLARALHASGDIDAAREQLADVPEDELGPEGRRLLAEIAEERGDSAHAAELFERLLDDDPADLDAAVGAGRNHIAAGAPARAQQHLLRAAEETSDESLRLEARTLLAQAQHQVGDTQAALDQFRSALDALDGEVDADRQTEAEARLGFAQCALEIGELRDAADQFESVVSSGPADSRDRARLGLAECRIDSGSLSEARRMLDDIDPETLDPEQRARRSHLAGRAALAAGEPAEALASLQEALRQTASQQLADELRAVRDRALDELRPTWDLPDGFDGPVAAERTLAATREFLESAPHLEAFRPQARELADRMSQPLSIAIVGEFNAGKSTLVNALLGEEVVPTGILPTTAHTCYIRYGPRKTARVHYRAAFPDETTADADPGEVVEVGFDEARRRMDEETEAIDYLEFLYPHPQLRSIEFRDTPGFNAVDGDDRTAADALEDAEAILWVFDAGQTLSRTELDRLREIPDGADRLVVLLNKIDELDEGDVDELESHIDRTIGDEVAGQFAVSARDALRSSSDRSEGDGSAVRFDDFRDFLDRRFVQRAGRIKTLEVGRRLTRLVDAIDAHIDDLDDRYRSWREEAGDIADWVDEQMETRRDEHAAREADTVADQFQFAITSVARDIREDLRPRGTFFTRLGLDDEDRQFALDLLRDRLEDILERSNRRVRSDIGRFENRLAQKTGAMLDALPVVDSRTLQRRLDGLDDESDALRRLLDERVYGRLSAELRGRLDAGGTAALSEVEADDPEELAPWRDPLERLVPDPDRHVDESLTDWYREFSVAVRRFIHTVERDLEVLRLELRHRYDLTPLRDLVTDP